MTLPVTVLVVAKAPEPGLAKTRLAATVGNRVAAEIAAAALLDTLDAVAAAPVAARVVALTGNLDNAAGTAELRERLGAFTVVEQRGDDFAERLVNAHADAASAGYPVLQIGMDTPQVSAELLTDCARRLLEAPAVLGMAQDGGWWVLGVRSPEAAQCLRGVPMSQSDTGNITRKALQDKGIEAALVPELADIDVIGDVAGVRAVCGRTSRFARATEGVATSS